MACWVHKKRKCRKDTKSKYYGSFKTILPSPRYKEDEKSLRHVAVIAKFLDDSKPNCRLKCEFPLVQFHLLCKILEKLSGADSGRIISEFRKRRRNFLCCVHQLHKAGA